MYFDLTRWKFTKSGRATTYDNMIVFDVKMKCVLYYDDIKNNAESRTPLNLWLKKKTPGFYIEK